MTSWQRRARVGVAVFGIASAVAVYFAYGGRRASEAPPAVRPLPPKVLQQTLKGVYEQVSNERKDFDVAFSANRTFEDGTNEVDDVRITARNRDGRVFIVTARTGRSTKDNQDIELITNVRLSASDGFELTTDHGVYNKASGVVSTAGAVAFSKARMSGTGIGMTYEQQTDILRVNESSHINVRAEGESPAIDFTAGSAILDRLQDVLVLDRTVHVVHGAQITDADHSTASLSPEDDRIKFVELRGNSRVEGGDGPLRAMHARDIDLHYADDGQMLERAVLIGQAVAAMRGQDGAPGREFAGELLDVSVGGDGSLKRVFGEGDVVMTLPAWSGAPARVVQARTFEAKNSEGTSQTRARFTDHVVFREKSVDGAHSREARSGVLTLEMSSSDAVSSASFSDDVTFEEDDLRARAPDALYDPGDGMLRLTGRSGKGRPTVEDRRVRVEAESIDIGLEKHHIEARVRVKTTLRAEQASTDGAGAGQSAKTPSRLPRLLAQDQDAKVTADTSLVYDGSQGTALYSGHAWLWQGDTEIRGETIDINQSTGDLTARGSARSGMALETGRSEGWADEIRYVDSERVVTYTSRTPERNADPLRDGARVTGPQGDLHGRRISVFLHEKESRVQRIEASEGVSAKVEARTFTGKTLSYRAEDESYNVTGTANALAKMEEGTGKACRSVMGKTLTAFRSTDVFSIDGRKQYRTETMSSCTVPISK